MMDPHTVQRTWELADRVQKQVSRARMLRTVARSCREWSADRRHRAAFTLDRTDLPHLPSGYAPGGAPAYAPLPLLGTFVAPHSPQARKASHACPDTGSRCKLYVWGYGLPSVMLQGAEPTAEARAFAAERGWDDTRDDAWALELPRSLPLSRALAVLEPSVRPDPAVTGWGGRTIHSEPRPERLPLEDLIARAAAAVAQAQCLRSELEAKRALSRHLIHYTDQCRRKLSGELSRPRPLSCFRSNSSALRVETSPCGERSPAGGAALPQPVFDRLNRTLTRALNRALDGALAEGYSLLLQALHAAEEAACCDVAWAEELVRIYHLALENYSWRFGLSLE